MLNKLTKKYRYLILSIIPFIFLSGAVFCYRFIPDIALIILLVFWLSCIVLFHLDYLMSIKLGVIFIIISPLFLVFRVISLAEMFSNFAFVFLFTGICHCLLRVYTKTAGRKK